MRQPGDKVQAEGAVSEGCREAGNQCVGGSGVRPVTRGITAECGAQAQSRLVKGKSVGLISCLCWVRSVDGLLGVPRGERGERRNEVGEQVPRTLLL